MMLNFDSNFSAWSAVLDSEIVLFLAKSYKAETDQDGKLKDKLSIAILKKSVNECILKECSNLNDGRATYATILQEIKEVWARGEKRKITSEDLPAVNTRDDWEDCCCRLLVVGYSEATLLDLLQTKLVDKNTRNLLHIKSFTTFSEASKFMDKLDWPEQTAALNRPSKVKQGRRIYCFKCGKPGHIQYYCRSKNEESPSPVQ